MSTIKYNSEHMINQAIRIRQVYDDYLNERPIGGRSTLAGISLMNDNISCRNGYMKYTSVYANKIADSLANKAEELLEIERSMHDALVPGSSASTTTNSDTDTTGGES